MSVAALENRPMLLPGLDVYQTALQELDHDRPVGFGLGSIPWSSIVKWGELNGFDADEISTLAHHIRAMEAALNDFHNTPERTPT